VLIVDDEESTLKTLSLILKMHGFTVFAARSGEEAVEVARQALPRWIISDIVMGGISGIEAAIQIREFCPQCRILLMSGNHMTSDLVEEARVLGYEFDILAKPFHPTELLGRLAA
jgi:DNA-binding response OmpR family regulator